MTKYLPLATILFATAAHAPAATFYVNNLLGNDRATGLSAEPDADNGPVRTIAAALARAGRADRVELAATGEPYREQLSLSLPNHCGFPDKPFVIDGGGAVLDGTVVAAPGAWRHVEGNVFAMRPRRLAYQQVFNEGQPLQQVTRSSQYESANLEPLQWALVEGEIHFRTEGNRIPSDYTLRHAALQTGITLYDVRHVRIENLVVQGFQQDGLNAHELVRDCQFIDIDSRANGRSGLSVGGVSRVSAVRCNFYENGRVQVRTEGLAELALKACDVGDLTAPAYRTHGRSLTVDGAPIVAP
jgi:hypothetical protein